MVIFNKADALDRVDQDAELLCEIIEIFLEDTPSQLTKLEEALSTCDRELCERQAHSVKGAASNVGAEDLREASLRAELAARNGDLDGARSAFGEMLASFEALKPLLSDSL